MSSKTIIEAGEANTAPKKGQGVTMAYVGTLEDGEVFDQNNEFRFQVGLGSVISCWDEQVQTMNVGERATLTCPANTAYGEAGAGSIPGGAALTFQVERRV